MIFYMQITQSIGEQRGLIVDISYFVQIENQFYQMNTDEFFKY